MRIVPPVRGLPKLWPSKFFYGWAIVYASFLISIAQVPMYGPVFSVFVKPIEDELGWSRSTITIAFTFGSIGGSLLSAVIGSVLDKYGARTVTVIAGITVASALFGIATMSEPWHFWIAYGIARSAALAGVSLGTSVAIANWFIKNRGRATAIRAMGQRGGQAIVPILIMPVLLILGWRESFAVLAVIALLFITLPAFFFIRRRPEDYGMVPDGIRINSVDKNESIDHEISWDLKQVRKTRTLWMITIGMSAGIAAQIAINVHAVANFQDQGMSEGLSITIASMFTGVAAVSMMGWGFLLDRIHVRHVSMISMALFIISMFILLYAESYALATLFAITFGVGTGGWTVSQMVMIPNYFGRMHAGSIKGFISPVEGIIGISGPLIAAFLFDQYGSYDLAFIGAAGAFFIGLITFYFAKPLDPSKAVRVCLDEHR